VAAAAIRRRLLYTLATSDRFESAVRRVPALEHATYRLATRYVAGRSFEDAVAIVDGLSRDGIAASVDFFGEQVTDAEEATRAADEYVAIALSLNELASDTSIAVDLSHIGIDISRDFCRRQLERIVETLGEGRRLDIGAEDSNRTGAILDVVLRLVRAGASVQMTIQANLRRSADDWPALVEAGAAIRLCKGAYVERPAVAYRYGEETDIAFVRLAHALHDAGASVALATHDPVLREALLAAIGPVPVEMLLGVRPDDARDLRARGVPVRLYVPFGNGWFRYWMRRVAEAQGA
jgi:proline dehydrogenase